MTTKRESKPKYMFWLYFFGFLLTWEWLRPLSQLTDTGYLPIFILYLLISLALAYYRVKSLIQIGIKAVYVFYMLNFIYLEGSFFSFGWIFTMAEEVIANMQLVFQGNWIDLTNFFRSILFFLLLTLMSYLLQYWLIQRKQIFLFFFITLLYITVLDTFTPYDATSAIVRIVIIGFSLMGTLTFFRIVEKEKLKSKAIASSQWFIPMIIMICCSVLIGYTSPKASPIWPDPVPYIKSYATKSGLGGGGVRKVGYGADDSQLGGPFVGDDTPVYEVETLTRQYWKVETKDVYTGKGWVASHEDSHWISFDRETEFPIKTFFELDEENIRKERSLVRALFDYPHLIYPQGLKFIENQLEYTYRVDLGLEKIYYMKTEEELTEYVVVHDSPRFSVQKLQEINDGFLVPFGEYTQLPDTLPDRVKELAVEITKDYDNWYDKAKAIEKYFAGADFQYSQTDVAIPAADEDYVDQFLFETQKGYCDNFSTSMVVLLRSIGIPARWVKGYTEGSFKGLTDDGLRQYVITNNNAHSWVEVFFPNVGWVPFEPTKGFTNSTQFTFDNLELELNETTELESQERPELELEENDQPVNTPSSITTWKNYVEKIITFFKDHLKAIIYGIVILTVLIVILYKTRLKWLPRYLLVRYHWKNKDEHFPKAYLSLLKQLERYGLLRKPEQTLSDYAKKVDEFFSTNDMRELTESYEKYIYKGKLEQGVWMKKKEIWENLIKRTSA